jgi:hypothetical protein
MALDIQEAADLDTQVRLWTELEIMAREMRTAQVEYFRNRTQSALARSKKLEAQVDGVLAKLSKRKAGNTQDVADQPGLL